jgi:hypothetical protein
MPIWLYRARLGFLLGHRFVYVAHRGRVSGARREVAAGRLTSLIIDLDAEVSL